MGCKMYVTIITQLPASSDGAISLEVYRLKIFSRWRFGKNLIGLLASESQATNIQCRAYSSVFYDSCVLRSILQRLPNVRRFCSGTKPFVGRRKDRISNHRDRVWWSFPISNCLPLDR